MEGGVEGGREGGMEGGMEGPLGWGRDADDKINNTVNRTNSK